MDQESGIKNIVIIVLILIIVGLFFAIFDVTQNESSVVNSVVDSVVPENEEESDASGEGIEEDADNNTSTSQPIAPKTVTPPKIIPTPSTIQVEPGVVVVTYTDSGFIPPVIEIRAGDSVTFVNSSTKPLWVTSENHPTAKAQVYRGFDQGKSMSSGGTYTFNFTQVGVWGYKNLNLEKHLGAVSVIPQ